MQHLEGEVGTWGLYMYSQTSPTVSKKVQVQYYGPG